MQPGPFGNIDVRGARENNLRDVSVEIPKRQITVFTGVSGSGKSSLVFDTIAAEAQRQLNATFSAFAQGFLPSYGRPDVDVLANLSAVAIVDQARLGGGPRSTVGTATDIGARIRMLFARIAEPSIGYSYMYSFNEQGMCPTCKGLGEVSTADVNELIDFNESLNSGALIYPGYKVGTWMWKFHALSGLFDNDKPIRDYSETELHNLLYAKAGEITPPNTDALVGNYEGLAARFNRTQLTKDTSTMKGKQLEAFQRVVTRGRCPDCAGTRLSELTRSALIDGRSIADWNATQVDELIDIAAAITDESVGPVLESLLKQLRQMDALGLGYLSLDRATATLSGGESQRIKMIRHLGSSLTDMLYIFDEPSIGLHAADVGRLNEILLALRDLGNTVLIVEHDPEVMAIADRVIDMGPGAGRAGGTVTFTGDFAALRDSDTLTGAAVRRPTAINTAPRTPTGSVRIEDARTHNLQGVDVDIPLGVLTAVTGVAGSGKSSLIHGHLARVAEGVVTIDQSPIKGSRRSSPATYTDLLGPIRTLYAKRTGAPAALFSPNSDGACPACGGAGVIFTDLGFLDSVTSTCETCRGRRFSPEANAHEVDGRSIADVFEMSVAEALEFFSAKPVTAILQRMVDVGLEYVALGQNLTTLSGGERQRLKLAGELGNKGRIYVLDEPTTGLHLTDVDKLIALMNRLVDDGSSVVVIEHNLDVIARADHVIDIGPGAGHHGGKVVFTGTVGELIEADTPTAHHLAAWARGTHEIKA